MSNIYCYENTNRGHEKRNEEEKMPFQVIIPNIWGGVREWKTSTKIQLC